MFWFIEGEEGGVAARTWAKMRDDGGGFVLFKNVVKWGDWVIGLSFLMKVEGEVEEEDIYTPHPSKLFALLRFPLVSRVEGKFGLRLS